MEVDIEHIRHCMLYEFHQKVAATEATRKICKVYGEYALDARTCQRWFSRFRAGNFNLVDGHRAGRPLLINHDKLREIIKKNPMYTSQQIADEVSSTRHTISIHLKRMGYVYKDKKWTYDVKVDVKQEKVS